MVSQRRKNTSKKIQEKDDLVHSRYSIVYPRRKYYGEITKIVQIEVAKLERGTIEIGRAAKICKHFAFVI
jgi:hypothetical protein